MKKILSVLLCLGMILSFMPISVSAAKDNTDMLEKFGFKPDLDAYDTNALIPGTHPIDPKYDLYVANGNKISSYSGKIQEVKKNPIILYNRFYSTLQSQKDYIAKEATQYCATTGFASTSTGVEDYYAKAYFYVNYNMPGFEALSSTGYNGGNIFLSIYDAKGNPIVNGYNTGGYVATSDSIEMWEIEGLLSITSGDFDGDGVDEIAVYTPNNGDETSSGSKHNHISVGIFEFDKESKTVTTKQYLDLPSKEKADEVCEWEYSHREGKKQFYSIPYVALCAEDLNGDGIDDLAAILNFSTWYRWNGGGETYSTKQLINHNTCFASVLEAYEGTKGGDLKQSIKHRVLVTDGLGGDTQYRYILRNANITVGDVTAEGSKEIIIGGWYTRANYKTQSSTATVTANRYVWVDEKDAPRQIVGYTSYENLKNKNTYDGNADYHWTIQETGCDWIYWYNEDNTDSGPITVPLRAFKYSGTGKPDTIFLGGQFFDYDASSGGLKFTKDYNIDGDLYNGSNDKKRETSVTWMGGAVSGNLTNDMFGREMLMVPFYYKQKGKDKFNCKVLYASEQTRDVTVGGSKSTRYSQIYMFEDREAQGIVSLALLDGNGRTSYITYGGNDTEVYFSDVEVLAIMQAPPLYEELNDDTYIGNSATGFAKSKGSSEGVSHGGALTAGVVAGFEQETSFLGLFKVAGAEYELSITGTVSYDQETETSYDYSTGFETAGTTDAVAVFAVPYVRYNCTMYVPEYSLPSQTQYEELCAFRDELIKNMEKYIQTGEIQETGTYVKGCNYYEYCYSSYVTKDNFQDQQAVLLNVAEEIEFIEKAIAECGKGGTGEWGGTVEGAILPYHYNIPQTPMVTTVDVATYDAIAEATPGLDKIYGNVFHEDYRAGDPTTYAHSIGALNATGAVLQSKQAIGGSEDGFLTNSNASAPGSVQSQTISVEKSESDTIGWGVAIENTSVANVGGAKVGFTVTAEYNGSSVKTSTEGNEYSGAVVALPAGTSADYSYGWKVVSYNTKLNGNEVPVVGYITKISATPPPSVAQNIAVEDVTDKSVTITWEDGDRTADYYRVSRVAYSSNGEEQYLTLGDVTAVNGKCSYTINNLQPSNTSYYVIESYSNSGKKSVASEKISVTTLPEGFAVVLTVDGIEENVIYRAGKNLTANLNIDGNGQYDTYYQWQKDSGDDWEDIVGQTGKTYNFAISTEDDGSRLRCKATIYVGNRTCEVYSSPVALHSARTAEGFSVDWNEDSVTVTPEEGAVSANIYLKAENGSKITKILSKPSTLDDITFDISDVAEDDVRLYIWNDKLRPVTFSFVR